MKKDYIEENIKNIVKDSGDFSMIKNNIEVEKPILEEKPKKSFNWKIPVFVCGCILIALIPVSIFALMPEFNIKDDNNAATPQEPETPDSGAPSINIGLNQKVTDINNNSYTLKEVKMNKLENYLDAKVNFDINNFKNFKDIKASITTNAFIYNLNLDINSTNKINNFIINDNLTYSGDLILKFDISKFDEDVFENITFNFNIIDKMTGIDQCVVNYNEIIK